MTKFYSCILLLGSMFFSSSKASEIDIPRITTAGGQVNIDANLSEIAWKSAKNIDIAYETSPGENTKAPVKTTALVMEDGDFFI